MKGIISFGAYLPRRRLERATVVAALSWFNPALRSHQRGERTIAAWDEDSITMAVEACRDCLTGFAREPVEQLTFASTSAPFADRLNAAIVKEALNLPDEIATTDHGGSQRAGLGALIQVLRSGPSDGGTNLCVASEKRDARPGSEAELVGGAGAAAFLVGGEGIIAEMLGSHSVSVDFVDHFRADAARFDYEWEKRWIRDEGYSKLAGDAIGRAVEKAGIGPEQVDALIFPTTIAGVAAGIAKKLNFRAEAVRDPLGASVGDIGSAHPLLMLAQALEEVGPGRTIVVAAFGSGIDVLILRTTALIDRIPNRRGVNGSLARRIPDSNYIRYLFSNGHLDLDKGMRAEFETKQPLTALYRSRRTVMALVGGRCHETGNVQFPKSEIPVAEEDRAGPAMEDYPLAERVARILTFTADNLTYSPDPPSLYGMVEFEGGGRMNVEFCDMEEEALAVGLPMRMMFRIKSIDEQRGFRRYFWKAAPADQ